MSTTQLPSSAPSSGSSSPHDSPMDPVYVVLTVRPQSAVLRWDNVNDDPHKPWDPLGPLLALQLDELETRLKLNSEQMKIRMLCRGFTQMDVIAAAVNSSYLLDLTISVDPENWRRVDDESLAVAESYLVRLLKQLHSRGLRNLAISNPINTSASCAALVSYLSDREAAASIQSLRTDEFLSQEDLASLVRACKRNTSIEYVCLKRGECEEVPSCKCNDNGIEAHHMITQMQKARKFRLRLPDPEAHVPSPVHWFESAKRRTQLLLLSEILRYNIAVNAGLQESLLGGLAPMRIVLLGRPASDNKSLQKHRVRSREEGDDDSDVEYKESVKRLKVTRHANGPERESHASVDQANSTQDMQDTGTIDHIASTTVAIPSADFATATDSAVPDQQPFRLLDLPWELVLKIVSYVADMNDVMTDTQRQRLVTYASDQRTLTAAAKIGLSWASPKNSSLGPEWPSSNTGGQMESSAIALGPSTENSTGVSTAPITADGQAISPPVGEATGPRNDAAGEDAGVVILNYSPMAPFPIYVPDILEGSPDDWADLADWDFSDEDNEDDEDDQIGEEDQIGEGDEIDEEVIPRWEIPKGKIDWIDRLKWDHSGDWDVPKDSDDGAPAVKGDHKVQGAPKRDRDHTILGYGRGPDYRPDWSDWVRSGGWVCARDTVRTSAAEEEIEWVRSHDWFKTVVARRFASGNGNIQFA